MIYVFNLSQILTESGFLLHYTMDIISQLLNENTAHGFTHKIKNNIAIIHDLLQAPKSDILSLKNLIQELILFKKKIILNLDYHLTENSTFLQMLLYLAIKLGLKSSVKTLSEIAQQTGINLPLKLKVALLYLGPYPLVSELVDNFDTIIYLINNNQEEEDDAKELTAMVVQYFAYMLYNYAGSNNYEVTRLRQKIAIAQQTSCYNFLDKPIIKSIIECNISDYRQEYANLIEQLDLYLLRKKLIFNINDYLIEENGAYYNLFIQDASYNTLMDIARRMNPNVYNELGRGVAILDSEAQMLQYLYSFGRMHEAKLLSAFETIDFGEFDRKQIELIDWGCGQGIASILFKEFANRNNCNPIIDCVTLIEPSELCIKRAALHIREILRPNKILTLNSTLDDLSYDRIKTSNDNIKIHLFSNILDVEAFSLKALTQRILSNFGGKNYFICKSIY